jgi:hypothetical protein
LLKEIPTENKNLEVNTIPPTAHEDQFRIVKYPTAKSDADPDRVFYTTTSCTEGIRRIEQPPWFFGNQNKTKPPDSSMLLAANRYGFRGSRDIKQFHTKMVSPPEETRTDYTPKFLVGNSVIDEWVPPLRGEPIKEKGFALTSPLLWPENANHTSGFKQKKRPTSPVYNRETTIGTDAAVKIPPALIAVYEKQSTEKNLLSQSAVLESKGEIISPPIAEKLKFSSTWQNRLDNFANASLKMTMQSGAIHQTEQHKLMDGDHLRYSGSTALLMHSCSTDELKYRLRLEIHEESQLLSLKWRHVIIVCQILKVRLRREHNLRVLITDFGRKLLYQSIKFGQKNYIDRAQFLVATSETREFEHVPLREKNLLFSAFDELKRNLIRFVSVLAAMTIFDNVSDSAEHKLNQLWLQEEEFGDPQPPLTRALNILTSCCGSDREKEDMERVFESEFKPACYNYALRSASLTSKVQNSRYESKVAKMKSFPPAYNICDGAIDSSAFAAIINECPDTLELFRAQMQTRIGAFIGSS